MLLQALLSRSSTSVMCCWATALVLQSSPNICNHILSVSNLTSSQMDPAVLHPLDNPPPGVLILCQDLRVVGGRFDGSLSQIVGCLDFVDKLLSSFVVLTVLPAAHRLLQPVVVHLNDGEELQGLLSHQVVQLSLRTNLGELWLPEFLSLGVLLLLEGEELPEVMVSDFLPSAFSSSHL